MLIAPQSIAAAPVGLTAATATSAAVTVTIRASADTYVDARTANTGYGAGSSLQLSLAAYHGFLRFNLASVPAGSTVSSVTLKLWSTQTVAGSYIVHPASDAWSEKSVTYNTAPKWNGAVLATSKLLRANGFASTNLPTNSIRPGGVVDFGLSTTRGVLAPVASRESAPGHAPVLVVTYTKAAPVVAPVPAVQNCNLVSKPCVSAGTSVASGNWKLSFGDEFNAASIDPRKWDTGRFSATTTGDVPFNPGAEGAYFASANVSEANGVATFRVQPGSKTIAGRTYRYSSGLMQSAGHYYLTPHTYVESRIRVPHCDGCWPAFWAVPTGHWPPEFDMFEFFNTNVQAQPHFNFHLPGGGQTGPAAYGGSTDYRNSYHVYGMYWDGAKATVYVDGVPYRTVAAITALPEFLIFNLSTYAGHTPAAGSQMNVDWVRVWR